MNKRKKNSQDLSNVNICYLNGDKFFGQINDYMLPYNGTMKYNKFGWIFTGIFLDGKPHNGIWSKNMYSEPTVTSINSKNSGFFVDIVRQKLFIGKFKNKKPFIGRWSSINNLYNTDFSKELVKNIIYH